MILQRLFSKLPESRIGIGWMQEKLGKNEAEKYFKVGQKAADTSYEKGDDEETIIKKSKNSAGNKVILDKSGKPILQGSLAAGGGYLVAKSPGIVESLSKAKGIDLKIPGTVKNTLGKHAGKIAAGVGLVTAGRHIPDIYAKQKAARTGMEINTKDRIRKKNKKK